MQQTAGVVEPVVAKLFECTVDEVGRGQPGQVACASVSDTRRPSSAGIDSSTTAKAPAASRASASSSSRSPASPRPCTRRIPPSTLTLCGVRPRCPMTGMPAATSISTWGTTVRPPSSLTAWAPPSLRCRTALVSGQLRSRLVAAEGQVGHDQSLCGATDHGLNHRNQLVHRDWHGVGVAEHQLPAGITDEQCADVGLLKHLRVSVS